jgi:hypothetical protein
VSVINLNKCTNLNLVILTKLTKALTGCRNVSHTVDQERASSLLFKCIVSVM